MQFLYPSLLALSLMGCSQLPAAEVPLPSPGQASLVVSDIDGTLTPEILAVNQARPDAAKALRAFAEKGYRIVYVSTRIPLFQSGLPAWLRKNGFPEGSLHVAQSSEDRGNPARFKAQILNAYVKQGWRLAYGFGDSSTDFAAYAAAGIPKERVFALKRKGAKDCQPGLYQRCLSSWTQLLPYIAKDVATAK
ncbi:HAD family acid phosphatase [Gallaecimonas kandeliae]|uniref:LNS2 domain-containing protein n=1 Tax=Gallaecimonas kandeliae TaxID=3029055 RepID=UPI00264A1E06|nr:HAD family acid phosphatase [Gallaecimonas kandeliae]WKE64053.1 HAD family acid phosphatase [Gallaecimonas kandeliae]